MATTPKKDKYPYLFKSEDDKFNLEASYQKAWSNAKKAAEILKKDYGAHEVWIFGSLTNKNKFHKRSDIDLAEAGIPDSQYYSAFAAITRVIKDFEIDLVDMNDCKKYIKKSIKKEGIKL